MTTEKSVDVTFRSWSNGDFELIQQLMGDPNMTRHLGGPETLEQIKDRHKRYCALGDSGKGEMFVILVGSEGKVAGSIGYWEKESQMGLVWETGWSVLPELHGQGIATKATIKLIEKLRKLKKHKYLHAYPSTDNAPSNAICNKTGFTLLKQSEFEYPPGNWIQCNDWRLDLHSNAD